MCVELALNKPLNTKGLNIFNALFLNHSDHHLM